MFVKSLEIQGFKSFPDRTRIDFDSGVTVIVGPNGSGKSNISDAIRWVLGEQSTKALRGGRMEDVIFAGAADRRALASAEVSLTMDNSSGFLKSEYNEVTVTRKFYRSGDSEFFINRKTARLKDIHELFMDTGLGRDGYSMISQGKIDEIFSIKSEDRREIFDEATGISKYRYRREEAQRRLSDADLNLARINEMIDDMSRRIEPMKIEAKREKKYIDLQDKIRSLDISLIMDTLSGIGSRLSEAKQTAEAFLTDLEESRKRSQENDRKAEEMIRKTAENQRRLEELRDTLRACERRLSEIHEENIVANNEKNHISAEIERLTRENRESEEANRSIDTLIDQHNAAIGEAEGSIALETELIGTLLNRKKELDGQKNDVSHEFSAKTAKAEALNTIILETSARNETSNSLLKEFDSQLASLMTDERSRDEALSKEKQTCGALRSQLSALNERTASLNNIRAGYELRLSSRKKRAEELGRVISQKEMDTAATESRYKMLSELEKDYEGFGRAVKAVMRESRSGAFPGIHGPVSSLMKLEEEYIPAAETALAAAMQNIVVDSEQDARRVMGWLKSRDIGRATFMPLTVIRPNLLRENGLEAEKGFIGILSELIQCDERYRSIFRFLLGRTVLVDHLDNAIAIASDFRHRFRIVTLDGQIINAGGTMTGGSLNRSSGVLSRANEISKLQTRLPAMQEELKKDRGLYDDLMRELQAAEYQLIQTQNEYNEAQSEALRLSADLRAHEAILNNISTADESRQAQAQTLSARINTLKTEVEENNASLTEKREIYAQIKTECENLAERLRAVTDSISDTEQDMIRSRMKVSGYEARINAERSSVETLRISKEQADLRASRRAEELKLAMQKEIECTEKIASLDKLYCEEKKRCDAESENIRKEVEIQHEYEKTRIETERLAQEENRRAVELERRSIRAQSELEAIENESAALDTRLWDSYELTRSQAKQIAAPVGDRAEAERELEKHKREVRSLGTVYPGAMAEYDSLVSRCEFMINQKNDAVVSRGEILEIISDINSRMKEIFSEQFEIIAKNFSELFTRIFGGGTAKIELTDPDNVLTSGIDIAVQPPGKKLKVLTLLSGGERALAAIALYFAIMTVHPAPFCVLDEIESALDEANVRLFAGYLQEMSGNVQFIVISHRRGTMEAADTLYGVAMPKQGISRILALNVAQAEKEYIKE